MSGNGNSKPRLLEDTSVPVIYADDIGRVEVEGSNLRILFVEFRKIAGERVAVPVIEMIRPITSYRVGLLMGMINQALADHGSEPVH